MQKTRRKKKIRKVIRKQLQYIRRDLGYITNLLENNGVVLSESDAHLLDILETVYSQQQYMFVNSTHFVENRIVSISQPYIRPIVRGRAKSPVEFGAKLDLSVDENGMCRIEKLSFDAYNERRYHKSIDYSQNEHRPSCGDTFALCSFFVPFRPLFCLLHCIAKYPELLRKD